MNRTARILLLVVLTAVCRQGARCAGSDFAERFTDSTLRIDYVLTGRADSVQAAAALRAVQCSPGWYGRRGALTDSPVEGQSTLTLTDDATGDTIYTLPFSTLFQEWLATGDTVGPRAMEGSLLMPRPRLKAHARLHLRDNRRRTLARADFPIDPADVLIAAAPLPSDAAPRHRLFEGDSTSAPKIRVALLPEGYTRAEMDLFLEDARRAVDAILSHEPFASMADRFDFIALAAPSVRSGVSVPAQGLWTDSRYGSHFSTFYSDRYLTAPRVWRICDDLVAAGCQHAIILANTDTYGGGGILNMYTLTAAHHPKFSQVIVHEFGHSFAGLADEYFYYDTDVLDETYPTDTEPWEPNITARGDEPVKWQPLIDAGAATLVEGAGYRPRGLYRPAHDCRMRSNTAPEFCAVCRQAIERMILFLTQ